MKKYLVGGAVRDTLLNLPIDDKDWVIVGTTPQELTEKGFIQVGRDFPVFLHPTSKEEYALARTERKSGKGYTGFICDFGKEITLEQDLIRRDLTINAIAMDENNQLVDPYLGVKDINNRILRHVSPAFREDPLRILRVARFAARFHHLGFTIAPETLALMKEMVQSDEISSLTPERVWKETNKALATQDPQVYFEVLKKCHALAILFPELDELFGVFAPKKYFANADLGLHTLLALKKSALLTTELTTRFAVLCHDFGKGRTNSASSIKKINSLCQRAKIPNDYRDTAIFICQSYEDVENIEYKDAQAVIALFNKIDVWRHPHRLEQLILSCIADNTDGSNNFDEMTLSARLYLENAYKVAKSISPQEIINKGFKGKEINLELTKLRIKSINDCKNAKI